MSKVDFLDMKAIRNPIASSWIDVKYNSSPKRKPD